VTRQYWPAVGGVERVAMNLGQALRERGHEVSVVAQAVDETRFGRMTHIIRERKRFSPFSHEGVRVAQFRPSRLRRTLLLPFAAELIPLGGRVSRRWLRAHTSGYYAIVVRGILAPLLRDADVVHVLGAEVMAVAAVETARRLGKPVAISPFAHPGEWGLDAGSVRAYRHADVVLATTEADARAYRDAGVQSDRLEVVGLPVPDAGPPNGAGVPAREGDGSGERDPLVLFLGQRRPTKRVELLVSAIPHVWRAHPRARFAFVGPGAPIPIADERVLDVGRVSDTERGRWLARADLLCLPSQSESFGLVVPEAWSQGVPVVVSDIPVLRELVTASGGGVVAAPEPEAFAEAIGSLLAEPALARSMGRAGYDYWERNLIPAAVAGRHLEIYERIGAQHA
jgi:glycosyltransferase involved in cell wall biosynthesis